MLPFKLLTSCTKMPDYHELIARGLSAERFASYRDPNRPNDKSQMARYMRNLCLCESIYPSLAVLEVALRNGLHAALMHKFGTDMWMDNSAFLAEAERTKVDAAKEELGRQSKPITSSN